MTYVAPGQGHSFVAPATRCRLLRVGCVWAAWILIASVVLVGTPHAVEADGANLTGRKAPDLVFPSGLNGDTPGSRLHARRGRVVLLTFWLHTCPICLRKMHEVQRLYDQWSHFGLEVVTVVHKVASGPVQAVMKRHRWTFPVALDRTGSAGVPYRVRRRPAEYLIGADGRVVASNRIRGGVVAKALGKMRVGQISPVPSTGASIATLVQSGRMGSALRQAESLGDAAFAARVRLAAQNHLHALVARIRGRRSARRPQAAQVDVKTLQRAFQGTSLASEAKRAHASLTMESSNPGKSSSPGAVR